MPIWVRKLPNPKMGKNRTELKFSTRRRAEAGIAHSRPRRVLQKSFAWSCTAVDHNAQRLFLERERAAAQAQDADMTSKPASQFRYAAFSRR